MLRGLSSTLKRSKTNGEIKPNGFVESSNSDAGQVSNGTKKNGKEKSDHKADRAEVESIFEQYSQLIHAAMRPLPTQSGDGSYLEHDDPTGLMQDLRALDFKDIGTLIGIMKNKVEGELVDDKTYLMERTIQLVAALPPKSKNRVNLTNAFLDDLWDSMQHPPLSYMGDKFKYRSADGSNNNPMDPKIGAANTAYARSIAPVIMNRPSLPDPGLIFDSIFARQEFKPHPNKVSSVFFDWASLIIHDLFQTDHRDINISQTSSYLDLSTLYGDVQEDQDQIRTFEHGKIKPDCFSEKRLLGFPAACGVLLIMLNRFHNYVVEQLALINENGRFTKPADGLPADRARAAWAKYDDDLFQTGRLIVCGLYINITLYDYLRTIVNLNRSNTTWTLDPRVPMDKVFGEDGTPRGVGNQVSIEFNLAYRWHSATSAEDEKWTDEMYQELFNKPGEEVTLDELKVGLGQWEQGLPDDPMQRPFAGLQRQEDGTYNDDDLVRILTEATEDVAGSFGPRNVPKALRGVEILGMYQARQWNCGSLNEFRKFFGLKPHSTFEEINSDPYISDQLRHLYEHPDFVELYPGIVAEEAKVPMVPGVGIAPTFTISRAVLSDAVALVRGDRYYTIDYHPKNLTNWGFNEVQYDLSINQGCCFYKLYLRAFPNHAKTNSIYAHYPMTIPSENKKILTDLGRVDDYSWDRPARIPPRINLTSYGAAKYVLERAQEFHVTWGEATGFVMGQGGLDFMLSGDTQLHTNQRKIMSQCLYKDQWHQQVKDFYEYITLKLLREKSCKIAGINQVDLTRDVGNLAHVHFASSVFSLPLKTEDNPHGIFSEQELWMAMSVMFTAIFFDFEPTKSFPVRQVAREIGTQLGNLIEANVKTVNMTSFISGIFDSLHKSHTPLTEYGVHMIRRLLESGLGTYEIARSQILPTACAMIPNQSQVFTQIMDYYLSSPGTEHLPEIHRLAHLDTPEADEKILHYAMEAIRLNGTFGAYRESQVTATVDDNGKPVHVKPGDKVFVSFVGAARDPNIFPDPDMIRIDRPLSSYIHYGHGPHTCLGKDASMTALTAMLKTVGKLDNLRRAPGPQGQLKKIPRPGGFYVYMRENEEGYFVFPTTMKVHFDGELHELKKY